MDKKLKYFSLTLVIGVVALLTACGGGGSTDATPVVPPPTTTYMEFAYVGNAGDNNVSQYIIDSTTGALSANSPALVNTLETQNGIATTPDGEFAYITRPGTTDKVSQYIINDDGTLTWVADTATGNDPWGIVVDPLGLYAYVANSSDDTISQFTITSGTGVLVANSTAPIPTGAPVQPTVMAIDPSGSHLYVAYFTTDVLVHYSIQPDGTLQHEFTTNSSITAPIASPTSIAITPDGAGDYLYLANQAASGVSIYSIDANGDLARVGKQNTGAGGAPDSEPASVVIDPTGTYLYVANNLEDTVSKFSINAADGTLTQIGTETPAVGAFAATINPTGEYLYVTDDFNDKVHQFKIEANGDLTAFGTPAAALPLADPWFIISVGITR